MRNNKIKYLCWYEMNKYFTVGVFICFISVGNLVNVFHFYSSFNCSVNDTSVDVGLSCIVNDNLCLYKYD